MATVKLSGNDKRNIAEFYVRGMYSQQELADMYDVHRTTVRRAIKEYEDLFMNIECSDDRPTHEIVGRPNDTNVGLQDNTDPNPWFAIGAVAILAACVAAVGIALYHAVFPF